MNKQLKKSRRILIKNWDKYKRDFIWRYFKDPYKIMIAEFMLQRTKAPQVEPVYKNFLEKYPDVFILSRAKHKSISKFTTNLGLHGRSRNFIEASKFIIKKYTGNFPSTRKELLKIPGIGDYVAGTILTICFNKQEYVIDSNIARFINRFWGLNLSGEIRRKKIIISLATELFKYKNTRDLLFCLLDFSALICKPRNPVCETCVLRKPCFFYQ